MTDAVLRKSVVTALLAGLATINACTYWHGDLERIADQSERDFRRNLVGPFTDVEFKAVLAAPSTYRYVNIRFDAILNRVDEKGFIPFWTTFGPDEYVAFSLWPSGAKLWQSSDRAHSHPLCFLRKDNPGISELLNAGRFSLVRVSATVMSDFELKPWLEVNRLEVIEPKVYTDDALVDLSLAKDAMAAKKPAVAIRHYENALGGIWTMSLRLELHLTLAHIYEGRGDSAAALNHFRGALINAPDNQEALQGVERNKQALAGRAPEPPPQQ
jgi:tetratricopeptide (TPR) repeat protein